MLWFSLTMTFFSPWIDNTPWSMSVPWTNSISLVLMMKDNWKMRGSPISWYRFPSIHQWILENPARVMTTADIYNLYLFFPWRCFTFLISFLHWKANIMSLPCLAIPTNSTSSYSICCLIIMGNGLKESNFQQITTIWRGFLLFHCRALNSLKTVTVSSNISTTIFLFFHRKGCVKKGD